VIFFFCVCDFWRHNESEFDFDYANEHKAMFFLKAGKQDTII